MRVIPGSVQSGAKSEKALKNAERGRGGESKVYHGNTQKNHSA